MATNIDDLAPRPWTMSDFGDILSADEEVIVSCNPVDGDDWWRLRDIHQHIVAVVNEQPADAAGKE